MERVRAVACICWFTPRMPTRARSGPGLRQDPGACLGLPLRWQGPTSLPSPAASQDVLAESWMESKVVGLKPALQCVELVSQAATYAVTPRVCVCLYSGRLVKK